MKKLITKIVIGVMLLGMLIVPKMFNGDADVSEKPETETIQPCGDEDPPM